MEGLVGTFNQEEGPGRGLFLDCENFADGSFAALILARPHEVRHVVVCWYVAYVFIARCKTGRS